MSGAFLKGEKVYLRSLEEADITEKYVNWLNDPEVTRYLVTGRFPSTLSTLRVYWQRFQSSTTDVIFAINELEGHQHIGNVTLNRIDWIHRTGDTGLMIGRRDFWGQGFAFEAWSLLIEYAFDRLGLRKLMAGVAKENIGSIKVLEKLGFKVEGTSRSTVFVDGVYSDGLYMGLFREEFYKFTTGTEL